MIFEDKLSNPFVSAWHYSHYPTFDMDNKLSDNKLFVAFIIMQFLYLGAYFYLASLMHLLHTLCDNDARLNLISHQLIVV